MNFEELFSGLIEDTVQVSLLRFSPELAICATILGLLFVRLFGCDRWLPTYWVAMAGSLVAFGLAFYQFIDMRQADAGAVELFTGLLVFDKFAIFFRLFLLLFLTLVIALTVLSGIPDLEDGPDFYTLLLGSTIGMMLMASANHLLVFFLAIEMTSVPSFVMVAFLKGRRLSSEAAFKFAVYGAGAAGVMLYGISLLAGLLGTLHMPEMAARMSLLVGEASGIADPTVRTVAFAILLVLVGLAFKLSVVPFHFWTPDAFEGASAEVGGFLSVASKAAAFALLVRLCLALVGDDPGAMRGVYLAFGIGLGVIAAVTATFGNLAAYAQTNIKRLLAYSTIAHAGYMLMAVGSLMVILNAPAEAGWSAAQVDTEATRALEGLLYYLCVYLFMNLGAFAIVALIRNQIYSEEIEDYNGLGFEMPVLGVCMMVCMFSLVGMPPLGGFVGKLMIFASLFQAGWIHWSMWVILAFGGLNTVFSLYYYLRVLWAMFLLPRAEGARPVEIAAAPNWYAVIVSFAPLLWLGIAVQGLSETAQSVASALFR